MESNRSQFFQSFQNGGYRLPKSHYCPPASIPGAKAKPCRCNFILNGLYVFAAKYAHSNPHLPDCSHDLLAKTPEKVAFGISDNFTSNRQYV